MWGFHFFYSEHFTAAMNKTTKIGLVAAGFVAALAGAGAAVGLHEWLTRDDPAQSGSGMYAFGDLLLFLGGFAFLSIFPTTLALYFLRGSERFWNLFSLFSLALAATAPLA